MDKRLLPLFLALVLPGAVPAANPATEFLPQVVVDAFNPDVDDAGRAAATPTIGGKLRIRTPADYATLNAITVLGQPERVIINHLSDSLVDQDRETLEYYGEMAWMWTEADLVKRRDGEAREGRIVAKDDDSLAFVPGARIVTTNNNPYHVAEVNEAEGYVVLAERYGGERIEGEVTILDHTVRIDEGKGAGARERTETIPSGELDVYTYTMGNFNEERPFAKRQVAYEFFLRPGATWSDGQPFTPEDVKFSYETIMNPAVEAAHLRAIFQDVELCEVDAERNSVRFRYKTTYFQALGILGGVNGSSYFIPRHVFQPERFGGDEQAFGESFNDHQFGENPVYTGPYVLDSWERGDTLTIRRNEAYWKNTLPEGAIPRWRKGQPYLDEISWVLYREAAAVLSDLESDNLDVDFDVEPATWAQERTNSERFLEGMIRADKVGYLYTYIGWNMENPLFEDVNVRRALAMLIPREEIARDVHEGVAFPVDGPFYFQGPGYDKSVEPIRYDPTSARRLLMRSGWLDRDRDGVLEKRINGELVPFEFSYSIHNARDYHQKIADIVKENVEQVGIRMNINKSDWTIFSESIRDKNFDAVRFAWGAPLEPDPFMVWHSSQAEDKGNNFVSYRNDRVDELCVLIREELDPAKRWEMAREAHRLIHEDQPYCFLFGFRENFFIDRGLRGIRLYPDTYTHDLAEWYWKEIPENRL